MAKAAARYVTLRASALKTARSRGHQLQPRWIIVRPRPGEIVGGAACRDCGASVQVFTKGLPDGTDMFGEAVSINCQWNS